MLYIISYPEIYFTKNVVSEKGFPKAPGPRSKIVFRASSNIHVTSSRQWGLSATTISASNHCYCHRYPLIVLNMQCILNAMSTYYDQLQWQDTYS